jgi:hypothetical protein
MITHIPMFAGNTEPRNVLVVVRARRRYRH